jgi:hypothetical protein
MSVAKWTALGTESSSIAGTALDSKANGTTTFIADIANTTDKDLYLNVWVTLGSITPTTGSSVTLQLRQKRSSTYSENTLEQYVAATNGTGARVVELAAVMRIPHGGTFGLYWTNNLGVTSAASGNAVYTRTWNEDIV